MPKRKVLIISLGFIAILIVISYFAVFPFFKIEDFSKSQVYSEEVKNRFAPSRKIYTRACNFDLVNPEVYSIFNESDETQYVIFHKLRRANIFDQNWVYSYEIDALGGSRFYKRSFEEVKNIFSNSKCEDIRNIDNETIDYFPPLTPEQIKEQQEILNKYQNPDPSTETLQENVERRGEELTGEELDEFQKTFLHDENSKFTNRETWDWEAMQDWLDERYPEER